MKQHKTKQNKTKRSRKHSQYFRYSEFKSLDLMSWEFREKQLNYCSSWAEMGLFYSSMSIQGPVSIYKPPKNVCQELHIPGLEHLELKQSKNTTLQSGLISIRKKVFGSTGERRMSKNLMLLDHIVEFVWENGLFEVRRKRKFEKGIITRAGNATFAFLSFHSQSSHL